MSNRPYYEPKLVSILAPLMYEFIKMLQIKGIHPYHYVTIFKEIDSMHETKELDSPVITRELFSSLEGKICQREPAYSL